MNSTEPKTCTRKLQRMARSPDGSQEQGASANYNDSPSVEVAAVKAPHRVTKQSLVLDLVRRPEGALLSQIVEVTGWLPHTARAALTGLKKKGHAITSTKLGKVTRYSLADNA